MDYRTFMKRLDWRGALPRVYIDKDKVQPGKDMLSGDWAM